MKKLILLTLVSLSTTCFADGMTIPMGTTFVAKITAGATGLRTATSSDPVPVMAVVNFNDIRGLSESAVKVVNKTNHDLGIKLNKEHPNCVISGAAILDSGVNRAKIRTSAINCSYPDGSQYSTPLQGWFADYNDKMAGINVKDSNDNIRSDSNVYIIVNQTIKLAKVYK